MQILKVTYTLHLHGRSRVNSIPKSWYLFNRQNGVIFNVDLNHMVFKQGIDLNNVIFNLKKKGLYVQVEFLTPLTQQNLFLQIIIYIS
jgi:hypothetical protein